MTTALAIIVFIVVLIVLALFAERELYRRRKKAAPESAEGLAETAPLEETPPLRTIVNQAGETLQRVSGEVRKSGRELITPEYVKLVPVFRTWIEKEITGDERLKAWLLSLPDEAFKTLTGQVVFFCTDLNIDFTWLVSGELDIEPKTRRVVTDIVISYCDSCLKAVQIQDDLARFREYQDTLAHLGRGDSAELGQRLLARLREEELAPPTSPQILLASAEERRLYALETIRNAAQQDREKFNTIWKSVLAANRVR